MFWNSTTRGSRIRNWRSWSSAWRLIKRTLQGLLRLRPWRIGFARDFPCELESCRSPPSFIPIWRRRGTQLTTTGKAGALEEEQQKVGPEGA